MTSNGRKPKLDFTEEEAAPFIGKTVLAGLTRCDLNGEEVSREQFFGTIEKINLRDGLVVRLHSGEGRKVLPPDISHLKIASPGQYRLRKTEEIVEDPDFTSIWTIYPKGYKG